MTLPCLVNTPFSLKRHHGSKEVVYFKIFSKITLTCSILNFFWKHNIAQIKVSISKFSQKWHCTAQFSVFSEKRTWFKASSLFLNFLKNHSRLFIFQFSLKREHGLNQEVCLWFFSKMTLRCPVLNFLWKDNIVQTK